MVRPERKPNVDKSKPCSKCGVTQPLENFRINHAAKDGRQSACKPCQRKVYEARAEHYKAKARAYRAEHLEEIREKQRDYFRSRAEWNRKRVNDWYWSNIDRARKTRREVYSSNPERWIAETKKWKQANRERANRSDNQSIHRRRARMRVNGVFDIRPIEIARLYRQACAYCGSKESIQLDHVIPIARGGTHSIGNLISACSSCNASKGSLTITEWRKRESPRA